MQQVEKTSLHMDNDYLNKVMVIHATIHADRKEDIAEEKRDLFIADTEKGGFRVNGFVLGRLTRIEGDHCWVLPLWEPDVTQPIRMFTSHIIGLLPDDEAEPEMYANLPRLGWTG